MSRIEVSMPATDGLTNQLGPNTVPVTTHASDINPILAQLVGRPGPISLFPTHVMSFLNGMFGVPYWMYGYNLKTCNGDTISAPSFDSTLQYPSATGTGKDGATFGTSPTVDYTGEGYE